MDPRDRDAEIEEVRERTARVEDDPDVWLDPARSTLPIGQLAWSACVIATKQRLRSSVQKFAADNEGADELPRWPSTLQPIDQHYGGFYGVTSLVAEPGIGKTMLAWAAAMRAAATMEWNVIYWGGELDEPEMMERRMREMRQHPGSLDGVDFLTMMHVGKGQRPIDFCVDLCGNFDPALPILQVFDSINTISKLAGGEYLRTIEEIAMWAMLSRRLSNGAASFLIVSEANKRGRSKGEQLEYWSDLVISMTGKRDELAVDFNIEKIRRGKWEHLGMFMRHHDTNRFYTQEQIDQVVQPRLVWDAERDIL